MRRAIRRCNQFIAERPREWSGGFYPTTADEARGFWEEWCQRAMEPGVAAIQRFAERIKACMPGVLAHAEFPLHTSFNEGINNRIRVIERMPHGFRDDKYFFKIRAAYPGNAR